MSQSRRSCDRPLLIEAVGDGLCGLRRVKRGDSSVGSAQEAVIHATRVDVVSHDRAPHIDTDGESALAGACACALNVECGDFCVGLDGKREGGE